MPPRRKAEPEMVEQLRQAIRASGLSLAELARRAELGDHSRLSRFMRSERSLSLEAGLAVAEALRLELTAKTPAAEPPPAKAKGRKRNGG